MWLTLKNHKTHKKDVKAELMYFFEKAENSQGGAIFTGRVLVPNLTSLLTILKKKHF